MRCEAGQNRAQGVRSPACLYFYYVPLDYFQASPCLCSFHPAASFHFLRLIVHFPAVAVDCDCIRWISEAKGNAFMVEDSKLCNPGIVRSQPEVMKTAQQEGGSLKEEFNPVVCFRCTLKGV